MPTLQNKNSTTASPYIQYAELTEKLQDWQRQHPDLVRLESLATTDESREVWLFTIGPHPDKKRPALWVDANMHASELAGTEVCLAIIEDLLRIHQGKKPHADIPAHLCEVLKEVLFYIVPRVSPDGAQDVLDHGRFVRSKFKGNQVAPTHPYWHPTDLDNDGLALMMRREDPSGDYVVSSQVPNLMLPRTLEDAGPYYRIYPEGIIENFDGKTIPEATVLAEGDIDFNRNFPTRWAPDWEQAGAGPFALSEIETRSIAQFISRSPHIFAVLNLHTFGGVMIRPPMHGDDALMDAVDLSFYRQLEQWSEDIVGYPMVSGFQGFSPRQGLPVYGSFMDFTASRGIITYAAELWDLFSEIGAEPKPRFVEVYAGLNRDELTALGHWDAQHNQGRAVRPWKKIAHPQLGSVEVGGIDPRVGIWNPPAHKLGEICTRQTSMLFRVAAMAPRLVLREIGQERISQDVTRIQLCVENIGYLPSYGTEEARKTHGNNQLHVEIQNTDCEVVTPHLNNRALAPLKGWGKGLYRECSAIYEMYSSQERTSELIEIVVKGHGALKVSIGNKQCGWTTQNIEITHHQHIKPSYLLERSA